MRSIFAQSFMPFQTGRKVRLGTQKMGCPSHREEEEVEIGCPMHRDEEDVDLGCPHHVQDCSNKEGGSGEVVEEESSMIIAPNLGCPAHIYPKDEEEE